MLLCSWTSEIVAGKLRGLHLSVSFLSIHQITFKKKRQSLQLLRGSVAFHIANLLLERKD